MNGLVIIREITKLGTSLAGLGAAYAAVVFISGGNLIPWVTPAEAAAQLKTTTEIQQQMITTLKGLTDTVQKVGRRVDNIDCDRANGKLQRAMDGLRRNPGDVMAKDLRESAMLEIHAIDNCMPDPGPYGRPQ